MTHVNFSTIVIFLFTLTSCNVVRDEFGYFGGYPERLADDNLFVARSQHQRADRYFMVLAILAPIAADLSKTPAEARASAALINQSYRSLSNMYKSAGGCLLLEESKRCDSAEGTAYSFDYYANELQNTLYSLGKQTLGSVDLDELLDDIFDLNYRKIVRSARSTIPIMRRALSIYRDSILAFSDAAYLKCDVEERRNNPCKRLGELLQQVKNGSIANEARIWLDESHDGRVVAALQRYLKSAISNEASDWRLKQRHISGLMRGIDDACRRLRHEQEASTDNGNPLNCGIKPDSNTASAPRDDFVSAVKE